ncbi:MAG TPA: PadR family transcriptional regulator [Candidatus Saccharimonadales bacterium]|nr:PadR family transcriptional regulator [Candidatus Saccharimonadales bacterium]
MTILDKRSAMRKGLLELAVLKIIAKQKAYTSDIIAQLATTEFATQEGTLYPLLSRMSRDGLVSHAWTESKSGPPRKYYELTEQGRTHLFQLDQYWRLLVATMQEL